MFVYWAGWDGAVCKKRAADGLSYLSFSTVAQLSSDKGAACIPSEKTLTHPPTPSLPPPRPRQVPHPSFLPLSLVVRPVRGAGQVPLEECEGEKLIYLHSHQHRPALADIGQRVPQPTHEAELGTKEA